MKRPTRETVLFATGAAIGTVGAVFGGVLRDMPPAAPGLVLDAALFGTASGAWHGTRAVIDRHEEAAAARRHRRPRPAPGAATGTMAARPPAADPAAVRDVGPAADPHPPAPVDEARAVPATGPADVITHGSGVAPTEPTPAEMEQLARAFNNYLNTDPPAPARAATRIARLDDTDDGWSALTTAANGDTDLYWHPQAAL